MGKTTHFHPVSLPVIRGSALKCGYQLGRIVQTHIDETYAYYRAHLLVCPDLMVGASCEELAGDLNGCYAQDVTITKVEVMRGKVWAYFRTMQTLPEETGLEWLIDHPDFKIDEDRHNVELYGDGEDHSDIPF